MPNIHHRPCGVHSNAEQINNMMDYERCSLFELMKLSRSRKQRYREEKLTFVQDNPGLKKPFCVLDDDLLSAEDELFREEGQIVVIIQCLIADTGDETVSAGKNTEKYAISMLYLIFYGLRHSLTPYWGLPSPYPLVLRERTF